MSVNGTGDDESNRHSTGLIDSAQQPCDQRHPTRSNFFISILSINSSAAPPPSSSSVFPFVRTVTHRYWLAIIGLHTRFAHDARLP